MDPKLLKVYAVTDRCWLNGRTLASDVRKALEGGATILQLREKNMPFEDFLAEAWEIKAICDEFKVPLIIDDDVEIARQLGIGIHVGQEDMAVMEARRAVGPDVILGASCQTVEQAIKAEADGADYLGVGAVFPTSTKSDAILVPTEELKAICAAVKIPVVAIGGIGRDNIAKLAHTGIAGVAVVSAIFAADDIKFATMELNTRMSTIDSDKAAIVDMDGTILDSLGYWENLGIDYLAAKGKVPKNGIKELLDSMEVEEAARYLKAEYGFAEDEKTIEADIFAQIRSVYTDKALIFPHAKEFLEAQTAAGIKLILFTASECDAAFEALKRNGIAHLFQDIISTTDIGIAKSDPEAYRHVLKRLGIKEENAIVYEDAPYAIEGAQKAGLKVITLDLK